LPFVADNEQLTATFEGKVKTDNYDDNDDDAVIIAARDSQSPVCLNEVTT
jgi:hypothetical protein